MNTPASPDSQQGDPVAVILARMEVKLDNALTEQARHGSAIERLEERSSRSEDRLTAVETTWRAERVADRLGAVERKVWGAAGAAALLSGGGVALVLRVLGN